MIVERGGLSVIGGEAYVGAGSLSSSHSFIKRLTLVLST